MTDLDLQHFERQTRIAIRVVNFLESLLQAWQYEHIPLVMLPKIAAAIIHATKTQMQTLTPLLGQFVQLRRDLYLSGSFAPMDIRQKLRHAPILGKQDLFPGALLLEIDDRVKRSCESSIILQTFRKSQTQKSENRPKPIWHRSGDFQQQPWGRSETESSKPVIPCPESPLFSPWDSQSSSEGECPERRLPSGDAQTRTPPQEKESDPGKTCTGLVEVPPEIKKALRQLQEKATAQKTEPVGGRLKRFWKIWKREGTPKRIYNWFRKGYFLPFGRNQKTEVDYIIKKECPDSVLSKYAPGSPKQKALDELVAKLLEKNAIEEVPENTEVVFNRVFLRAKANKARQVGTEFRLIIDLTQINKHLNLTSFEMDTPAHIRRAIEPGMWATSLDLSDTYHHIPIRPNCYKYLAFQVKNRKYWYKVCPFVLSPIPQVFTAAMGHLKQVTRTKLGIAIFQYIDDWLLLFENPDQAAKKTIAFTQLCQEMGLIVNLYKSELLPAQIINQLGIKWNLQTAWVSPAERQVQNISNGATMTAEKGKARVKQMESLLGKMVAAEKQTKNGRINFRSFQKTVIRAVKTRHTNVGKNPRRGTGRPSLVGQPKKPGKRRALRTEKSGRPSHNGRLKYRLGSVHESEVPRREVVKKGSTPSHQPQRTAGSPLHTGSLGTSPQRKVSPLLNGKPNRRLLRAKRRENQVTLHDADSQELVSKGRLVQHLVGSPIHSGSTERCGRHALSTGAGPQSRMEIREDHF